MIGFGHQATHDKEVERNLLVAQVTPEDLERYGMIPELIGRLPVISALNQAKIDVRLVTQPVEGPKARR